MKREWFLNEARVAIPIFPGERPGKPDYIHVISADYCEAMEREVQIQKKNNATLFDDAVRLTKQVESLEREVRALREICEASSITLKSYSLPNRIRDEREREE